MLVIDKADSRWVVVRFRYHSYVYDYIPNWTPLSPITIITQGRGKGYQPKPKVEAQNPYQHIDYSGYQKRPNLIVVLLYSERKKWMSCFCLFTEGKQHRAREIDTVTLTNHAPRSYMI